jgi:hypothetical protein
MGSLRLRRNHQARIPITIALERETYAFVEECARQKHFRSVDEFFEAALAIFKNHVEALNAYVELEEAKGKTLDEIMSTARCEIVFTRQRS